MTRGDRASYLLLLYTSRALAPKIFLERKRFHEVTENISRQDRRDAWVGNAFYTRRRAYLKKFARLLAMASVIVVIDFNNNYFGRMADCI
jgi:hypothetical protein